jgi:hypothetical protein
MSDYYPDSPPGDLFAHFTRREEPKSVVADMRKEGRPSTSEKRRRAVELLRTAPRSCEWLDVELYRGQAVVCELRKRGHIIDTVLISGVKHYRYVRKVDVVRVTPTMKECYYMTSHWRAIAAERKRMDGNRCCQCGATTSLHTHHWRYEFFRESLQHDLITLCASCHDAVHDAAKGSSIHFPETMHADDAERLFNEFPQCRGKQ